MQSRLQIKRLILILVLGLINSCGGGSGDTSTPPAIEPPQQQPPIENPSMPAVDLTAAETFAQMLSGMSLDDVINVAMEQIERRDPETIVALALEQQFPLTDALLTDIRYDYQRQTYAMWEHLLSHLNTLETDGFSEVEQTNFDVLLWIASQQSAQLEFLYYEYPATYFLTGVPSNLELFFADLHPIEDQQDVDNFLIRLGLVDDQFESLLANLTEMEENGIIEPSITMQVAINRFSATASSAVSSSPYVASFTQKVNALTNVAAADKQAAIVRAEQITQQLILPAYQSLVDFLNQQITRAPSQIGVGQFPNGQAYYQQRLAFHTTTDLSADDIHQLGIEELARVHSELNVLFDQLGYPAGETLKQKFDRAAVDGGIIPAAQVQQTYENLIEDARVRMLPLFERFPVAEVVVIGGDSGGYYVRAALDGSRPGAFYAATTSDQPYFSMPSLAYHEALPGHHMQIALAQETNLPLFRRNITATGYVEGWGLYAERLAGDYGWYENDIYGDIGRLFYEGLRAARLVVDTGIHVYGWDFDQATRYFEENVGVTTGNAQGNIARYSIYTGQATAYMVGMLKILELRAQVESARGEVFDIKEFHSIVLDSGAVPLTVLESIVADAIND